MPPASRLRRSIDSLQSFDCSMIDAGSRDAAVLAQVLGATLEEARAGQVSWSERELISRWLDRNGKLAPASCSGLCRQLETRLTFSFLPGLSWPGRETVHTTHHGGRTRATDAFTTAVSSSTAPTATTALATTSARRNLVGLVPPMDKSTEVAVSAAAAAASAVEGISSTSAAAAAAALGMESFGTGGAGSASAGQTSRGGRAALEDGNCSSTDDEGIARDGFSPGLGSPDVLPSVLEQGTVDVNSLEEADDDFLLSPTPKGVKNYCIIHRTSSRIRTYFRLFLQEQRAIDSGSTFPAPSTPVPIGTGGTSTSAGGAWSGVPAGSVAQNIGSSGSGGGGGGIETLKAFLTSGGTGAGSGSGGGSGGGTAGGTAGTAGAGGVSAMGSAGELGLGRFLLSSKRYRSTRSRSATFVWSNNGVWKDKQALAKVATQPWGKSAAEGILNCPSLLGGHGRSPPANSPTPSTAASTSSGAATGQQSPPLGGKIVTGSPGQDGSDGKSRSPTLSTSSGGGAGAGGGGGGGGGGEIDGALGSMSSWAIVVRVQSEGEAKLLTATAIVPDPSFGGSICASSSSSSSKDAATAEQTVEAALAEGLRAWDKTGIAPAGTIVLRSKQAKWSAWQGCHTLDFDRGEERVREPSRKNMSMVDSGATAGQQGSKGRPRKGSSEQVVTGGSGPRGGAGDEADADAIRALPPILQVGKISEDQFSLDFRWPLSPLQAFVVAMSIFDG